MKTILATLLLFCLKLQSQEVSFQNELKCNFDLDGSIYKIGQSYFRYEVDFTPPQLIYTARLNKKSYAVTLFKHDQAMKETVKIQLENGKKNFGPFDPSMIAFNDKVVLLYFKYEGEDSYKLFADFYDTSHLQLIKTIDLYTFKHSNTSGFAELFSKNSLNELISSNTLLSAISPDSTHLAIVQAIPQTGKILTVLLDTKGQTSKKEFRQPNADLNFHLSSLKVDNQSNFILSWVSGEEENKIAGIIAVPFNTKEIYFPFNKLKGAVGFENLNLDFGKDFTNVYAFGTYRGSSPNQGLAWCSLDLRNFQLSPLQKFAYPDNMIARLIKMDFTYKNHGIRYLCPIVFDMLQLDNGTLFFMGIPRLKDVRNYVSSGINGSNWNTRTSITFYDGPVIALVPDGDHLHYDFIPRNMFQSAATNCIFSNWENKVYCLYCDRDVNLNNPITDNIKRDLNPSNLQLAYAVFDNKGNLLYRKKIANDPPGKSYFIMDKTEFATDGSIYIPVGIGKQGVTKQYETIHGLSILNIR